MGPQTPGFKVVSCGIFFSEPHEKDRQMASCHIISVWDHHPGMDVLIGGSTLLENPGHVGNIGGHPLTYGLK